MQKYSTIAINGALQYYCTTVLQYCTTILQQSITVFSLSLPNCGVHKNFPCLFNDAVSCWDCTSSVLHVNIEEWCNRTDKGELRYWDMQVCPSVTLSTTNSTYRLNAGLSSQVAVLRQQRLAAWAWYGLFARMFQLIKLSRCRARVERWRCADVTHSVILDFVQSSVDTVHSTAMSRHTECCYYRE